MSSQFGTTSYKAEVRRMRAETIIRSRIRGEHSSCAVCITTEVPGQPCNCQCPVCVAAQLSTAPRFAIREQAHGWEWTYTSIRAEEAQWIADLLSSRGETWTVHPLGTCQACSEQIERVDTPLPASWAPVPWWHHMSEAAARACPGTGPVQPA